jgi:hypothetical protein
VIRPSTLSFHEMRDKEMRGLSVESDKYGWEWHDEFSRGRPSNKPIPKGDPLARAQY